MMRSRCFSLVTSLAVLAACAAKTEVEERAVFVYAPAECAIPEATAYAVLYPEGDREPPEDLANASFFLRDKSTSLAALSTDMRALIVDVSDTSGESWRGVARTPASGDLSVLAWPTGRACRLSADFEALEGATIAPLGSDYLLSVGGTAPGRVPGSFVTDLRTGNTSRLPKGIGSGRIGASVTGFVPTEGRIGALVSGGLDPESKVPLSDVEVYVGSADGTVGDFDSERIALGSPRANHAGVVIASGEVALVGGIGRIGPTASVEVVDGSLRRARTAGIALLEVARSSPRAVRLATGEVLVAGGVDANDQPVSKVEWLSGDLSRASKRSREVAPGAASELVALGAGGALYVVKRSNEDAADTWRIGSDGSIESAGTIANVTHLALASADRGGALFYTGNRWLSFNPWANRFEPTFDLPEATGPLTPLVVTPDPGLVLWAAVESGALRVQGVRHSTRSEYAFVGKPLLRDGVGGFAPDGVPGSRVGFQSGRGLLLSNGGAMFLTDVTFADVSISFDVVDAAPLVVLRDERGKEAVVGEAACPWKRASTQVTIRRQGSSLRVSSNGDESTECTAPWTNERISLGFRAPKDAVAVGATNLVVTRE